jgi:hypothetical protein
VILAVGHREDRWLTGSCRLLAAGRHDVSHVSEGVLYGGASVAFRRRGRAVGGHIALPDVRVDLNRLRAVLLRPLRSWAPRGVRGPDDGEFVFHETIAAWYGVMAGLDVPVVNRFSLPWWLHDASWQRRAVIGVAGILGLEGGAGPANGDDGLYPTPAPERGARSVYVVGDRCVAGSPAVAAAARAVEASRPELAAWGDANGIALMRLDLEPGPPHRLSRVEAFPALETEPPGLESELLTATAEVLAG